MLTVYTICIYFGKKNDTSQYYLSCYTLEISMCVCKLMEDLSIFSIKEEIGFAAPRATSWCKN